MVHLNNKQRDEVSKSLLKIAEYIVLTLIIGQAALGRFDNYIFFMASLATMLLYFISLFILRNYEEVN